MEKPLTDYLVVNTESDNMYNKYYLAKANTKKEAINKVFAEYSFDYNKKDFTATSINDAYKQSDSDIPGLVSISG